MSYITPVTADEKRWRAEEDARTLAEAQHIAGDPTRMSAAKSAADTLAKEESESAKEMRRVAGRKTAYREEPREELLVSPVRQPNTALSKRNAANKVDAEGIAVMPVKFLKPKE